MPFAIVTVQRHTLVEGFGGVKDSAVEGADGVAEVSEIVDCLVANTDIIDYQGEDNISRCVGVHAGAEVCLYPDVWRWHRSY